MLLWLKPGPWNLKRKGGTKGFRGRRNQDSVSQDSRISEFVWTDHPETKHSLRKNVLATGQRKLKIMESSWFYHSDTLFKKMCVLMFCENIFHFHQGFIRVFMTFSKSSVLLYVFNRFWSDFLPGIVSGKSFFREGCLFPDDRSRQILGSWNPGIRNPDSDHHKKHLSLRFGCSDSGIPNCDNHKPVSREPF